MKKRLAVFASGTGTNFDAIARACADGTLDALVELSPATFAGPDDIRKFSGKMPTIAPGEIAYFEFP